MLEPETKILDRRQSSRNPEVWYTIRQKGKTVWCDCPACTNTGECWPMLQIRVLEESRRMLARKLEISEIKLPDKQELIGQQWVYLDQQALAWLAKYPEDRVLPQYWRFANVK